MVSSRRRLQASQSLGKRWEMIQCERVCGKERRGCARCERHDEEAQGRSGICLSVFLVTMQTFCFTEFVPSNPQLLFPLCAAVSSRPSYGAFPEISFRGLAANFSMSKEAEIHRCSRGGQGANAPAHPTRNLYLHVFVCLFFACYLVCGHCH